MQPPSRTSIDRKGLLQKRVSAQSDYDTSEAEYKEAEASVAEIKATIERKLIRAPFTGVLGIRQVNLGQYLKSGDPVVPLQSLDPIYVNFSLPQQRLKDLAVGRDVNVKADGLPGETFAGKVTSIDAVVDEATRNVLVQATLTNPGQKLRPACFVTADVLLPTKEKVLSLPATAINYAPYGDSVFIVEKMKDSDGKDYDGVRQQIVELGASRGDQIAVVSGIKSGEEVVTSGGFKLAPRPPSRRNNDAKTVEQRRTHAADS